MTWTRAEQAEHRKRWVEALRSGDYDQATGALRDATLEGYCCLGVACDLALTDFASQKMGWDGPEVVWVPVYDDEVDEDGYAREEEHLPIPVRDWLGLKHEAGSFNYKDEDGVITDESLAEMNDNGLTFLQIADIIEGADFLASGVVSPDTL